MLQAEAYIIEAIRSPVVKAKTLYRTVRPDHLLAHILRQLLLRIPQVDPHDIGDVIIGCAMPEAEQGMNVARMASLLAHIPASVPAMTVNRFCASGLEAVAIAAHRIQLGQAEVIVAGGIESMTAVPLGGYHYRPSPLIFDHPETIGMAYSMGITAENVAQERGISREAQDTFALQSHTRALRAQKTGAFQTEIVPVAVEHQEDLVTEDNGPRVNTSLAALLALKPAFALKGSVTAGNSSQISDGAGAVLLASEAYVKAHGLTPLARFCGYATVGVAPERMGIGPQYAIPKVLESTGLRLSDIEWIELNEAFAAQSLAVIEALKLDPERVNPCGGAIALGHPLGATGAIRTATLVHGLKRTRQRYGMVTMCVGTGMGAAGVFEAL